jgi:alanyl-tRNA synthetase
MFLNSSVMYRFDFSFNRTIGKEELQQIEQRVNDVIRYI